MGLVSTHGDKQLEHVKPRGTKLLCENVLINDKVWARYGFMERSI